MTKFQRLWRTKCLSSKAPSDRMIRNLIIKFKDIGFVDNNSRVRLENIRKRNDNKKHHN